MADNYYDSIAKGYDELYGEEQILKLNQAYIIIKQNNFFKGIKTILDVGCGTGISTQYFKQKGFDVIGIDPSEGLISKHTGSCKLIRSSAEEIPFQNDSFDCVISFTAIQNFEDVLKGLDEIKRVGKKYYVLTYLSGIRDEEIIDKQIRSKFVVEHLVKNKDVMYFCSK